MRAGAGRVPHPPAWPRAAGRRVRGAVAAALASTIVGACRTGDAPSRDDVAVAGLALQELFRTREHATRLVVWRDAAEPGPVFELLGRPPGPPIVPAALAAAAGVPVTVVTGTVLRQLFHDHPDGWQAFYRQYAGSAGLVEIGPVVRAGGASAPARVVIGRACGEQCRNAWQVEVAGGRVVGVRVLRVGG